MVVDWEILIFWAFAKGRRDADRLRSCRETHSDAGKKRFVVHALDDQDWSPRFLRYCFSQTIGLRCSSDSSNASVIGSSLRAALLVNLFTINAFHFAGDAAGNRLGSFDLMNRFRSVVILRFVKSGGSISGRVCVK